MCFIIIIIIRVTELLKVNGIPPVEDKYIYGEFAVPFTLMLLSAHKYNFLMFMQHIRPTFRVTEGCFCLSNS